MGYRYIDDIIEEQERQKAELEDALATANLNGEIIDSISKFILDNLPGEPENRNL